MSAREHVLCEIDHPGHQSEGPHCYGCDEPWPCEVVRLREDLTLLNQGNRDLLRAGDEQRAEVRRLLEAVASLQTQRAAAERLRDADRAEAARLAAERDTVRNLYDRAAAELANAREDLHNATLAWDGQMDFADRLAGENARLSSAIADFIGWVKGDAEKSAAQWGRHLTDLEAALAEPGVAHVVLPIDAFVELVEAIGDTARVPRLATYLLVTLRDRGESRPEAPGPAHHDLEPGAVDEEGRDA